MRLGRQGRTQILGAHGHMAGSRLSLLEFYKSQVSEPQIGIIHCKKRVYKHLRLFEDRLRIVFSEPQTGRIHRKKWVYRHLRLFEDRLRIVLRTSKVAETHRKAGAQAIEVI